MIAYHAALKVIPHAGVIPGVMSEEFLQRADRRSTRQGDRFDTLARQVTHQAASVRGQVPPRFSTDETTAKGLDKQGERRTERRDLLRRHATPPFGWKLASARPSVFLEPN
jgi:hypothetical protein